MLFKLSLKNMKKSFKDYAIYFMTLILGVAIFYVFNSLDAQQAMMNVSASTRDIIKLMLNMLAGVSVFISVVLGFLIIYANNFLIKRRKKEFGIYMTLGMGKRKISRILIIETLLIGLISLAVGLVIGVFASQLMSIVVAKMFATDMSQYEFVFSQTAMLKTIIYFGIMYVLVMIFNVFAVSKYKLIDLLTAIKKNEKIKMKNPILSVILFLVSIAMLTYAYIAVNSPNVFQNIDSIYFLIGLGAVATFLFFWSLSGFILKLVQSMKKVYLKGLNMFTIRQINSKVNTTVFSMTIICLMLFVTIGVLSSALSLNNSVKKDLQTLTPVDLSISKVMHTEEGNYSSNATLSIQEMLEKLDFDTHKNLKDGVEISTYGNNQITMGNSFGNTLEEVKNNFQYVNYDVSEELIKLSDYNQIAKLFDHEEITLEENQYVVLCDYDQMKVLRDKALANNTTLTLNGKQYTPKEKECLERFICNSNQHINTGIIVLPDEALSNLQPLKNYYNVNYNATTEEGKQEIEKQVQELGQNKSMVNSDIYIDAMSKIVIYETNNGLGATVTFIGLYLGIIFLISSAAILALKELSESSDNVQRYSILRKLGADEKMINKALLTQIGIFFLIPLLLACIHSIFGLQFANTILEAVGKQNMLPSIIFTAGFIVLIYGGYFLATYLGSKSIIREK